MSKTNDRAKTAQNGNPSTATATKQVAPTAKPKQSDPVQAQSSVSSQSQSEQLSRQLAQLARKYELSGKVLLAHENVLNDHEARIQQLESDVKRRIGAANDAKQTPPQASSASVATTSTTTDKAPDKTPASSDQVQQGATSSDLSVSCRLSDLKEGIVVSIPKKGVSITISSR